MHADRVVQGERRDAAGLRLATRQHAVEHVRFAVGVEGVVFRHVADEAHAGVDADVLLREPVLLSLPLGRELHTQDDVLFRVGRRAAAMPFVQLQAAVDERQRHRVAADGDVTEVEPRHLPKVGDAVEIAQGGRIGPAVEAFLDFLVHPFVGRLRIELRTFFAEHVIAEAVDPLRDDHVVAVP